MSGLFTFGWTGSVLVSIMTEFGKLDRSRAPRGRRRAAGRRAGATSLSAQRQSRPAFGRAPQGPSTTFCRASSPRAVWLPARARSRARGRSSGASRGGGAGDHVAHVHEAVGLLGQVGGVVARPGRGRRSGGRCRCAAAAARRRRRRSGIRRRAPRSTSRGALASSAWVTRTVSRSTEMRGADEAGEGDREIGLERLGERDAGPLDAGLHEVRGDARGWRRSWPRRPCGASAGAAGGPPSGPRCSPGRVRPWSPHRYVPTGPLRLQL